GKVDVTAPDPAPARLAGVLDEARRLRVVDDDEVELALKRGGVLAVVTAEDLLLCLAQAARAALESVVDRLRHVEELVLAVDDSPFGLETRIAHERHERVEDLGHPAPESGRRQMQHSLAGKRSRERTDLVHQATTR